jgi:hypothetical protein
LASDLVITISNGACKAVPALPSKNWCENTLKMVLSA